MKKRTAWVKWATLGPIGYTIAPGSIATLFVLPIIYWLRATITDEWHYTVALFGGLSEIDSQNRSSNRTVLRLRRPSARAPCFYRSIRPRR